MNGFVKCKCDLCNEVYDEPKPFYLEEGEEYTCGYCWNRINLTRLPPDETVAIIRSESK